MFPGEHACSSSTTRPWSILIFGNAADTQRSVKFVRWLRQSIRDRVAEATAVPRLKASYASL